MTGDDKPISRVLPDIASFRGHVSNSVDSHPLTCCYVSSFQAREPLAFALDWLFIHVRKALYCFNKSLNTDFCARTSLIASCLIKVSTKRRSLGVFWAQSKSQFFATARDKLDEFLMTPLCARCIYSNADRVSLDLVA